MIYSLLCDGDVHETLETISEETIYIKLEEDGVSARNRRGGQQRDTGEGETGDGDRRGGQQRETAEGDNRGTQEGETGEGDRRGRCVTYVK